MLLAATDNAYQNVSSVNAALPVEIESREPSYYLVETRRRNHQAWFSSQTKSAYGYRCAFSGLPLRDLLVGAHIVPDSDGGVASVRNGICMSALHHTAFDAHLIGVDPDLCIHVSRTVFDSRDGPLLESLRDLDSRSVRVPTEAALQPEREYSGGSSPTRSAKRPVRTGRPPRQPIRIIAWQFGTSFRGAWMSTSYGRFQVWVAAPTSLPVKTAIAAASA